MVLVLGVTRTYADGDVDKSQVLGVQFIAEPFDTVMRAALEHLRSPERTCAYLCATGVHGVIEAQGSSEFRRILNRSAFNLADGMPIVFASRLLGHPRAERAFGPDAMWSILSETTDGEVGHYFYGGKPGVADHLASTVKTRLPGLRVVGTYCPPFRPLTESEKGAVARAINSSGADVVWVGLSTPKQERWVADMRHRLNVKLLCTVGAAFDYHTGSISPAPVWMKRLALEWLFRLMQEPRRLWRRYTRIVPAFLFLIGLQLSGLRKFPID